MRFVRLLVSVATVTASITLMQTGMTIETSLNEKSGHPWVHLGGSAPAVALEPELSYKPPQDLDAPETSRGTGSRGCNDSVAVGLTLLVPDTHVGVTASGHPSFYWHLSEQSSAQMEFALVETGVPTPIFTKKIAGAPAGIVEVAMPKELPELEEGKTYRWSVSVLCNEERRSSDVFAQAWIKRVAPLELEAAGESPSEPTATGSDRQLASVYAQAGLWYDALNAISSAYEDSANDSAIALERLSLLEQVGLNEVVAQERERIASTN
jgi:hypothetical protein